MPAQTILFTVGILLMGGLFALGPWLTRPDIFFAVTVAPEFRRTAEARRIARSYRVMVGYSALISAALHLAAGLALPAGLLLGAGFLGSFLYARKAALPYAALPASVVEVDLAAPPEHLPGGLLVAALPVLSLVALGAWAIRHLDRLPPRFPVHWGFHGPDRWVANTPVRYSPTCPCTPGSACC